MIIYRKSLLTIPHPESPDHEYRREDRQQVRGGPFRLTPIVHYSQELPDPHGMSVSPVRVGPGSALMNRDATALWRPLFTLPDSLFIKMQVKSVKVNKVKRKK